MKHTLVILAFILQALNAQELPVVNSFPTPAVVPFGLEEINGELWHSDRSAHAIFVIDTATGAVKRQFTPAMGDPAGLCWTGTELFCADWSGGKIHQIDTSTGSSIRSFSSPNGSPFGLAWDGNNIWCTEVFSGTLNKLDSAGNVLQSIQLPYWLSGMTFDGISFWLAVQEPVVNGSRKIVRMFPSSGWFVSYAFPNSIPYDLAWDGKFLWICGNEPDKIYKTFPAPMDSGLVLFNPNGGEAWLVGSVESIQWISLKSSTVRLDYSTDDGLSWMPVASSLPDTPSHHDWMIPATPSNTCRVKITDLSDTTNYDISEQPFTITNGRLGDRWRQVPSGFANTIWSVHVVDDSIVWAGGSGGAVLLSTDGGETWKKKLFGTEDVYNVRGLDALTAFATSSGSETVIKKTTDGGTTWTTVYAKPGGFINSIVMRDAMTGIATGDPVNGYWTLLKTTDGGTTWLDLPPVAAAQGEVGYNNATCVLDQTIWFTTNNPKAYKSTDYGETWTSYPTLHAELNGVSFSDSLHGVSGTRNGVVDYTVDGGKTWKMAKTGSGGLILGCVAVDYQTFYLTSGDRVFKSSDGGARWYENGVGLALFRHLSFSPSHNLGIAVDEIGSLFRYKQEYQVPNLRIQSPNGGERLAPGSVFRISWNAFLVNTVKLEYSVNNGRTWNLIGLAPGQGKELPLVRYGAAENVQLESAPPGFTWIVPQQESDSVLLRIADSLDASIFDVSDHMFSVTSTRDSHAMHFEVDISSAQGFEGLYGCEFINDTLYVSQWFSPRGLLFRFNREGAFIDSFGIAGMEEGFRDLAWDGQYLYGGTGLPFIYKVDLDSRSVVDTIVVQEGITARGVTYDQRKNAFWVCDWNSDIVCVNRNGATIGKIQAPGFAWPGVSGLACDNISPSGPFLWIFTGGASFYQKRFFKIDTLGNSLDSIDAPVSPLLSAGVGGGCFITDNLVSGSAIMGGVMQGDPAYLIGWRVQTATSISRHGDLPQKFELMQNFPNPFNPSTVISFQVPVAGNVSLKVFDLLGREVAMLENEEKAAGKYSVNWKASGLPTGVYFYRITAGNFVETKRMMLIK
ncbi:MAG: T9SS type A sorting domain-containing protein [Bacteroidota bacterium]